jgi:chitin deacetylase
MFLVILLFVHFVASFVVPAQQQVNHEHRDVVRKALPSKRWYHDDDHPVHALFKRGNFDSATPFAEVGSQGRKKYQRSLLLYFLTRP